MGVEAELKGWGSRIYEARTSGMRRKRGKQMTQTELGQTIGVSGQQIGFYESETNWPGWSKWIAIAKTLRVRVGWLIAGELPEDPDMAHGPMKTRKTGAMEKRPAPRTGKGTD